jgi:hypothetical protein
MAEPRGTEVLRGAGKPRRARRHPAAGRLRPDASGRRMAEAAAVTQAAAAGRPDRAAPSPDPSPDPARVAGMLQAGIRHGAAAPAAGPRFVRCRSAGPPSARRTGALGLLGLLGLLGRPEARRRRRTAAAWSGPRTPVPGRPGECRSGRPASTRSSGPARAPGAAACHRHRRAGRRRAAQRRSGPVPGPPGEIRLRGAGVLRPCGGPRSCSG